MEHTRLLSLLDLLPLFDRDLTGAHLIHTNAHETHQPNLRVIRLDQNHSPRRQRTQISLRNANTPRVDTQLSAVAQTLEEWLAKVRAVDDKGALHCAGDGTVPAVVGEGGEESLVNRAAGKLAREGIVSEHVEDGVRLALVEELVAQLDVMLDVEDFGLAGVGDDGVVVRRSNRTGLVTDLAGEEVCKRGGLVRRGKKELLMGRATYHPMTCSRGAWLRDRRRTCPRTCGSCRRGHWRLA